MGRFVHRGGTTDPIEPTAPLSPELSEEIRAITPGDATTVTIDGIEWYVLAKEADKAMLLSKDIQEERAFDADSPKWGRSDLQTYLNGQWLGGKATLKAAAVETTIYTRSSHTSAGFDTAKDKVFLLSEADVFGTQNNQTVQAQDYTYNGAKLPAPGGSWAVNYQGTSDAYWLRSPCFGANLLGSVFYSDGSFDDDGKYNHQEVGVRPAVWVQLAPAN